jgi:hypothetical protein
MIARTNNGKDSIKNKQVNKPSHDKPVKKKNRYVVYADPTNRPSVQLD